MKKKTIIVLAVVLSVAGALLGYNVWYGNNHIFVEDAVYKKDLTDLDLRGTGVSLDHYREVCRQLPDCEIRYDLPFQGDFYPDDTTELAITSLTDEEVKVLDYLPALTEIQAVGCRDYAQLMALKERHPDCRITYTVSLYGQEYTEDTEKMAFDSKIDNLQELMDALLWLPEMKEIHFDQPSVPADELIALVEKYPDVSITWEKDAFGTTYSHDVTEIELSKMYFTSLDEVEAAMAYYPALEKLVLTYCGYDAKNLFDDETLAAFREKMRSDYKVIWALNIYGMELRTDSPYFMPNKYGIKVSNFQVQRLRYCEDMLCVDLGHHPIVNLSFLEGMTHLKYFICIDSPLIYIEPISNCKELIYCELFWTEVSDFTPLLGCTALEDINVSRTNGDPMVFKDMPWLKNLWIRGSAVNAEERKILEEALPNTNIKYCDYEMTANGWRDLPNYFAMRDLLGMAYNRW